MTTKEHLHKLIDRLPDSTLETVEYFLESLNASPDDPVLRALMEAPWDDEPETEEERIAVQEAWEDVKAGRVFTLDDVKRELGL